MQIRSTLTRNGPRLTRDSSASQRTLFIVALTLFLDFAGLTLVIPLLPFWAETLGASTLTIGALATSYALTQLAFTPVLGTLSDRVGRKPIILLSLLIAAGSFALTALAGSLALLFLARMIGGLGASNVGAAQAIVSDLTASHDRTKAMGIVGGAIGLGHVVGPALGGLLVARGLAFPFWVACLLALLNAALVWRYLPETRLAIERGPPPRGSGAWIPAWSALLKHPAVRHLAAISLLVTAASMAMETVFALFTQLTLRWGPAENGWLFAYAGVVVLVQLGLIGRLVMRFEEWRLLSAGLALLAGGSALISASRDPALLLAALGLFGIGMGLVSPTLPALLSFAVSPLAQGSAMGLAQGVTGVGRLLGPLIAAALFTRDPGLPFLGAGAFCLFSLWLVRPRLNATRDGAGGAPSPPP